MRSTCAHAVVEVSCAIPLQEGKEEEEEEEEEEGKNVSSPSVNSQRVFLELTEGCLAYPL